MESSFKISVITPVYKAENFVRKAVESAVQLKEVGEIILVEDGSPDNSLEVCRALEKEYKKVKLFQHSNGKNRGAGASRNVGIEKAQHDYIAFLDADDWYLPNRFEASKKIFESNPRVDGVYEPVGTYFYSNLCYFKGKLMTKDEGENFISSIKKTIPSQDLFLYLLEPRYGVFCTDGIILRRSLVIKVGFFSRKLILHQDSEYWLRCAYYGRLVSPENPEIVGVRGVHDSNRISGQKFSSRANYYHEIFKTYKKLPLSFKSKLKIFRKSVAYHRKKNNSKKNRTFLRYFEYVLISINYLSIFFSSYSNSR